MKKINKKGFMMAETIVISVVVLGALILIYTQFMSINKSYQNAFMYNNVDKLYATKNVVDYLRTDGFTALTKNLKGKYLDISDCSTTYFEEPQYCKALFDNLNIKTVIFTHEDISILKNQANLPFTEEMKAFIKSIPLKNEKRFRLLVEFNDHTFATLLIGEKGSNTIILQPDIEPPKTYTLTAKCTNCDFTDIPAGSSSTLVTYNLKEGQSIPTLEFDANSGYSNCTVSSDITTMPAANTTITVSCVKDKIEVTKFYTLTMKCSHCSFKNVPVGSTSSLVTYSLSEGSSIPTLEFDATMGYSNCTTLPKITAMPAADTTITVSCTKIGSGGTSDM